MGGQARKKVAENSERGGLSEAWGYRGILQLRKDHIHGKWGGERRGYLVP